MVRDRVLGFFSVGVLWSWDCESEDIGCPVFARACGYFADWVLVVHGGSDASDGAAASAW